MYICLDICFYFISFSFFLFGDRGVLQTKKYQNQVNQVDERTNKQKTLTKAHLMRTDQ